MCGTPQGRPRTRPAHLTADKGYDSRMGARPLGRVIQEHIKQPLAEEVLFGKLRKGGTVKVGVKEDGSGLTLEAIEDGPVTPKPEPTPRKRSAPRRRRAPTQAAARKSSPPSNGPGGGGEGNKRGLVPKVPLKTN